MLARGMLETSRTLLTVLAGMAYTPQYLNPTEQFDVWNDSGSQFTRLHFELPALRYLTPADADRSSD